MRREGWTSCKALWVQSIDQVNTWKPWIKVETWWFSCFLPILLIHALVIRVPLFPMYDVLKHACWQLHPTNQYEISFAFSNLDGVPHFLHTLILVTRPPRDEGWEVGTKENMQNITEYTKKFLKLDGVLQSTFSTYHNCCNCYLLKFPHPKTKKQQC